MQLSLSTSTSIIKFNPAKACVSRYSHSPSTTFRKTSAQAPKFGVGEGALLKGFIIAGLIQLVTLPITIPVRLVQARKDRIALGEEFAKLNIHEEKTAFLKECLYRGGKKCSGGSVKWAVTQLSGIQDEQARAELILLGLDSSDRAYFIGQGSVLNQLKTAAESIGDKTLSKNTVETVKAKQAMERNSNVEVRYRFEYLQETLMTKIRCDREFNALKTEPERFAFILEQLNSGNAATLRWGCEQINAIQDDTLASELILTGLSRRISAHYPDERAAIVYHALKAAIEAIEDSTLKTKLSGFFSEIKDPKHFPADYSKAPAIGTALVEMATAREYPAISDDQARYDYLKEKLRGRFPQQIWATKQLGDVQDNIRKAELVLMALDKLWIGSTSSVTDVETQYLADTVTAAKTITDPELGPKVVELAEKKVACSQLRDTQPLWENDQSIQALLGTLQPKVEK